MGAKIIQTNLTLTEATRRDEMLFLVAVGSNIDNNLSVISEKRPIILFIYVLQNGSNFAHFPQISLFNRKSQLSDVHASKLPFF